MQDAYPAKLKETLGDEVTRHINATRRKRRIPSTRRAKTPSILCVCNTDTRGGRIVTVFRCYNETRLVFVMYEYYYTMLTEANLLVSRKLLTQFRSLLCRLSKPPQMFITTLSIFLKMKCTWTVTELLQSCRSSKLQRIHRYPNMIYKASFFPSS